MRHVHHLLKKRSLNCSIQFRSIEHETREYRYKTLKQCAQTQRIPPRARFEDASLVVT
jgi:hypothetical protein